MQRTSLSTSTMVGEAVRIADERGVDGLTMRQLATRLGVKAMALYHYVDSRDALLDAMVAALLDQLASTMSSRTRSGTTRTTYLTDTANDVRELALGHPWLIRLMVLRPAPAVWLSRPLSSLACADTFLDALHRRGFDSASSVSAYRTFNAFLLADLLLESTEALPKLAAPSHPLRGRPPPAPLMQYPVLASHLELLAADHFQADFEKALHLFVSSLSPRLGLTAAAVPAPPISTT